MRGKLPAGCSALRPTFGESLVSGCDTRPFEDLCQMKRRSIGNILFNAPRVNESVFFQFSSNSSFNSCKTWMCQAWMPGQHRTVLELHQKMTGRRFDLVMIDFEVHQSPSALIVSMVQVRVQ